MGNNDIALELVLKLCDEITQQNKTKWWSFYHWWCWGCRKFSKTPEQRCFRIENGKNTGCSQINKRIKLQNEKKKNK